MGIREILILWTQGIISQTLHTFEKQFRLLLMYVYKANEEGREESRTEGMLKNVKVDHTVSGNYNKAVAKSNGKSVD